MTKLLAIAIFSMLCQCILLSCSYVDEPDSVITNDKAYESIDRDSLIVNLQNLNDSLIFSAHCNETRGLRNFFRALNFVAIIAADIRGAVNGAKWGAAIGGVAGGIIGAGLVGVAYSGLAGLCTSAPMETPIRYNLLQENVEMAYVSVIADHQLPHKMKIECQNIDINIPNKYRKSFEVGVYHNLTLKALEENKFT